MKPLTHEAVNRGLTTYDGDHYLAVSMLKQSADELDVALEALGGEGEPAVRSLLFGIVQRMRFVAEIADQDDGEETP